MKTPIKITLKRLYNGRADVRSYIWTKAMYERRKIVFFCQENGQSMTIEHHNLKKGVMSQNIFTSKTNAGQEYRLVSFEWKPDDQEVGLFETYKEVRTEPLEVFDVLAKAPEKYLEQMRAIFKK